MSRYVTLVAAGLLCFCGRADAAAPPSKWGGFGEQSLFLARVASARVKDRVAAVGMLADPRDVPIGNKRFLEDVLAALALWVPAPPLTREEAERLDDLWQYQTRELHTSLVAYLLIGGAGTVDYLLEVLRSGTPARRAQAAQAVAACVRQVRQLEDPDSAEERGRLIV